MPAIPIDAPTIAINFCVKIIERGLSQAAQTIWEDMGMLLRDLWDAFPNLPKMIDLLYAFGSGLTGRIITIPFAGIEGLLLDLARFYGIRSRVMTVESCIKAFSRALAEVVTNLTGTSSSSITSTLLTGLARWTWALWKQFKWIQTLTRITSYEQLAQAFLDKFKARSRLLGVVLFVIAVFASIAWTGALALLMGLSLSMVTGEFQKLLLSQDSKRGWRKGGALVRQNRRRGPDNPN